MFVKQRKINIIVMNQLPLHMEIEIFFLERNYIVKLNFFSVIHLLTDFQKKWSILRRLQITVSRYSDWRRSSHVFFKGLGCQT